MGNATIKVSQVIAVLKSFNAPLDVLSYFERLEPTRASVPTETPQESIMRHAERLAIQGNGYFRKSDLQRSCLSMAGFKNDPRGANIAFNETLDALAKEKRLRLAEPDEGKDATGSSGVVYVI